jgi:hypothetical protein
LVTGREVDTEWAAWKEEDEDRIALSPDGRLVALGNGMGTVRLFDTCTRKDLGAIPAGDEDFRMENPRFSDRYLSVRAAGGWHLWDLAAGKKARVTKVKSHSDCCAFSPTGRLLADGGEDEVKVFEVESGDEVARLTLEGCDAKCLAFAADGRELAAGYSDTTIVLWDLTGRGRAPRAGRAPLSREEFEGLWLDLIATSARKASRAVWRLQEAPQQAIPFLDARLRPGKAVARQIEAWIADLDSAEFAVREKAQRELERLGGQASPLLKKALGRGPSPEVRRRVESLLATLESSGHHLRECRALEVLEYTRTPEARRLLEDLAKGVPEAHLTQEAKAALDRLARRP